MALVVAILETMYDWRGMTTGAGYMEAPRHFQINPRNHSGKRLYRLIGTGHDLLVTNACRELGRSAADHGKPNPAWLKENLDQLAIQKPRLILVCGRVAQSTYMQSGFVLGDGALALAIPHPAARSWTKELLLNTEQAIAGALMQV